jgi:hypothetical protein
MRLHPRPRVLLPAVLAPLLACKPTPTSPLPPAAAPAAAAPASTPAARSPAPPPTVVYGHVRIPSPTGLLAALRTSPIPEAQRSLFDESLVRSMLAMALSSRSDLAERIDLGRPMGCVVTSFRLHDLPLACVVGYQGGLTQLVNDLGPQGFVSGGDDYAAYRFEGRSVYLAAMGDHVAFSFAPDLIAATRDRLQHDLVDAPIGDEELVATAFPGVIFSDAEDQISAFLDQLARAQPQSGSAYTGAALDAQRRQWLSWGELERMDLWLDLTPARLRFGYRGTARPGTATEQGYAAVPAPARERELVSQLPASSLVVGGLNLDSAALIDDPMFGSYMQAMMSLDGSDAAVAAAEQYRKSMAVWSELFAGHASMALLHERGSKGGIVLAYRLRSSVDALARLREVLATPVPEGAPFRFELRPKALRVGKLRGDLWTMTPTDALPPQSRAGLAKVLGNPPQLHFGYVQRGDQLLMVIAPDQVERYLRRALAAADGKASLASRKDVRELIAPHTGDTVFIAAGFAPIARWLDQIDAIEPLPVSVPERLDDVVLTVRPAGERQREATFELSASLLGALLELGA